MKSIVAVVLLFVTAISADDYKRYDGYMLYSVYPTDSQVPLVQALSDDVAFDFWYEGKDRFDIFLPPHKIDKFVSLMTQHGIQYDVAEHNVQGLIDAEHQEMMERQAKGKQAFDYNIFNTLEAIHEELDDLVGRCPPSFTCIPRPTDQRNQSEKNRGCSKEDYLDRCYNTRSRVARNSYSHEDHSTRFRLH
jgi:hypothetical protein